MNILTANWTSLKSRDLIFIECDKCHIVFTNLKHRLQDRISGNKSDKLFCSKKCRGIYLTTKKTVSCKTCSVIFDKQINEIKKNKNNFCSHSCAAKFNNLFRPCSEKTKIKMSIFAKANPKGAVVTPHKPRSRKYTTPFIHICNHCKEPFFTKYANKRKYCSRICSDKNTFHPNSTKVNKSEYNGYKLDSGAELYFAQQLDLHNINWIKNDGLKFKQSFSFVDRKGNIRKYYPDFFLPDHNIWVEIKGRRYIRQDDDIRRASVTSEVKLLISNEFKTNLTPFFKNLAGYTGNDPA